MTEAANERPLEDLNPDEPGRYLDDIDAMSLEELEEIDPRGPRSLGLYRVETRRAYGPQGRPRLCSSYGRTTRRLEAS